MSKAREWYRWKRRSSTEFYAIWGVAVATYGITDIVTTLIIVYLIPFGYEANPIVRWVLLQAGVSGLIVLKLVILLIGMWVSRQGLTRRDVHLYYIPPVIMTLFGLVVTISNLLVMY